MKGIKAVSRLHFRNIDFNICLRDLTSRYLFVILRRVLPFVTERMRIHSAHLRIFPETLIS